MFALILLLLPQVEVGIPTGTAGGDGQYLKQMDGLADWDVPAGGGMGCNPGGSNNQLVTDDGAGGCVAEANATFDGSTLTVSGTVSATALSGPLTGDVTGNVTGNVTGSSGSATGNAGTATALGANGANCSAGQFPLGVDASGAAEGCAAVESGFVLTCNITLFVSTGLADTDDLPSVSNCSYPGRALTITSVRCETDAGSPTVMLQRNDGTAANMLTGNITCTTDRGGAAGTIDTAEDNIAATDTVDFLMVSASTANRVNILIQATVD